MFRLLSVLFAFTSGNAVAEIPAATFQLKPAPGSASRLEVEFKKAGAFTLGKIHRDGQLVLMDNGWNGQVFRQVEPGHWIGTGHPEGGTETPQALILFVDGKEMPLKQDTTLVEYTSSFALTKYSLLKSNSGERAELQVKVRLEQGVLFETFRMKFLDEIQVSNFYAFMHCWPPTSAAHYAKDFKGTVYSGTRTEGHLNIDATLDFFAMYHPGPGSYVMVSKFREDFRSIQDGNGVNLININSKIYHKQYTRPLRSKKVMHMGSSYEASMALTFLDVPVPAAWEQNAESAAKGISVPAPTEELKEGEGR